MTTAVAIAVKPSAATPISAFSLATPIAGALISRAMPVEFIIAFFVGVALLRGIAYNLKRGARAKRSRELAAWASKARLIYREDAERLLLEPFAALPLFHSGRKQRVTNAITGVWRGLDLRCFDFRYESGRKQKTELEQTVVVTRSEGGSLTEFSLTPRGWLMFHVFGKASDMPFPDDAAFSKAYSLRAVDEEAVRTLFHGEVRRYLATQPDWRIEGVEEWVVCCRIGRVCRPADLTDFLFQARAVRDLFFRRPTQQDAAS